MPLTTTFVSGASRALGFKSGGKLRILVEYLVIAGGGSGAPARGGGGGAGGYRSSVIGALSGASTSAESLFDAFASTLYSVTVGGGSSNSTFATITSVAGGNGGSNLGLGSAGGSGGSRIGAGTSNQGSSGGNGGHGNTHLSGGGGGAGGGGGVSGGSGLASSITGTSVARAGGGGRGYIRDQTTDKRGNITVHQISASPGGGGGGGAGGIGAGVAGTVNTGSGGGGGGLHGGAGGAGGSGIIILRYANTFRDLRIGSGLQYRNSGGTTVTGTGDRVAPSYTPSGYKVYEFRGGTGNIEF